jgi:hypothetical protein
MEQKVKEAVNAFIGRDTLFNDELKQRITSKKRRQKKNKSKLLSSGFKPVMITFLLIIGSASYYFLSTLPKEEGNSVNDLPINNKLDYDEKSINGDETVLNNEEENDANIERKLLEESAVIFSYLENSEFAKLAEKVDPIEGVTFTIFADFVKIDNYGGTPVTLTKDEIVDSLDKQFVWGQGDGGPPLEVTFREYVQEYLLKREGDKITYETITFNESAFVFAGVLNTIHKNYPNAKYVEYYTPGEDGNDRLFQSIRFVFEEREGTWYLIGVVRDIAQY